VWRARSQQTRRDIIRAGRDAFCALGYESTTLKAIATRANVSRPTINYHFSSKTELYRAVEDDAVSTVLAEGIEHVARDDTFFGQFHAFATGLVAGKSEDRARGEFLITSVLESARAPELRSAPSPTTASLRSHLAEMVDAAVERGVLVDDIDVTALVEFSLAMLLGMGLCMSSPGPQRSA
jgi:AcrR family transcriptional regulator